MDQLKQLVIKSLQSKGVLGQLRAKLRSTVFNIIDQQDNAVKNSSGFAWENSLSKKILEIEQGQIAANLIRQFLEFYRMDYSLGVFLPECNLNPNQPLNTHQLKKQSNLECANNKMPLLMQMIKAFKAGEFNKSGPSDLINKKSQFQNKYNSPPQIKPNTGSFGGAGGGGGVIGGGNNASNLQDSYGDQMFDQSGSSDKDMFGFSRNDQSKKKPAPLPESMNKQPEGSGLSILQNLPPLGQPKRNKLEAMNFDIGGLDDGQNKSIDSKKSKKNKQKLKPIIQQPEKKPVASEKRVLNDLDDAESVEEDIFDDFQESEEFKPNQNDGPFAQSAGGITVSQSLGADPSVNSLQLQNYDHVEAVIKGSR